MKYVYACSHVEGTTGFASCVPDPAPDLAAGLRLLVRRPNDSFLYDYLFTQALQAGVARCGKIIKLCGLGREPQVISLLCGLAAINPDFRNLPACLFSQNQEETPNLATGIEPASSDRQGNIREVFLRNIHQHEPLDAAANAVDKKALAGVLADLVQKRAKSLAILSAADKAGCHETVNTDLKRLYQQALQALAGQELLCGGEMRHEASLSPIALLRDWRLSAEVAFGRNRHHLTGTATAYGRGLSLAQARVSLIMEIIERASAHARVEPWGQAGKIGSRELVVASYEQLCAQGQRALDPCVFHASPQARRHCLHWLEGFAPDRFKLLVPVQAVYLFCNLDEPRIASGTDSTGLGAGATPAQARLAALLEIIERDAQANTPFRPDQCFELAARDPVIRGLLEDYRWRGIRVQFQDITTETGIPAYRCFVHGHAKGEYAQATGAALSGAKAVISALTETPWPYAWAHPAPAPSGPGLAGLPVRVLEDLPDFSTGSPESDLALLEMVIKSLGLTPVYVDISRSELKFPVYRAFIPGLDTDPFFENGMSERLLARGFIREMDGQDAKTC